MPKYNFHIVRIGNYDYKGRLEELYAEAEGDSMTLHIEEENTMDENAVRANMVSNFVGYVMRGYERMMAEELIRRSRLSVSGNVVDIDKEGKIITLEVDSDITLDLKDRDRIDKLHGWSYDGELLPKASEEYTLKDSLNSLQVLAESLSPVDDKMNGYINFIKKNLWRDAGIDSQIQMETIIRLFADKSNEIKGYREIARRLLVIVNDVTEARQRQQQVDYLFEMAHSNHARSLIAELGKEKIDSIIDELPKSLVKMFDNNPQEYVGRLWYLGCNYKKFRMLQTVMAMKIAIMSEDWKTTIDVDKILVGGERTLESLSIVMDKYYHDSKKNFALIYRVLIDKGLLVNENNYRGFVELLVSWNILPWMTKQEIRTFAYSFGQYMRDKKDHGKTRKGFSSNYMEWENDNVKEFCEEVAAHFTCEERK